MVQRSSVNWDAEICTVCLEAVYEAGFGDIQSDRGATIIATTKGDETPQHVCERVECDCTCVSKLERDAWREDGS